MMKCYHNTITKIQRDTRRRFRALQCLGNRGKQHSFSPGVRAVAMPSLWWLIPLGVLVYLVVSTVVIWFFPILLRPLWWLVVHGLHRFHAYHPRRVPKTGPVVLVSNHVSYLDWLYIAVACPRPVTFVLWNKYRKKPVLAFFLSFYRHRLIEIDTRTNAPHALAASLDRVTQALKKGECVLVFPEGKLTRNGQMLPFQRGIERVIRRVGQPVPIVPASLWNVWGTLASYKTGRMFFRWPECWRRRVAVHFGEPIPGTSKVAEIRAAVVESYADNGALQSDYVMPVHAGFVRKAASWRRVFKVGFVDASTGTDRPLTWGKALAGAWSLAAWLKPRLAAEERNVGVWLPTGLGSAFVNIALTFLHRTSVNLNYTAGRVAVEQAAQQAGLKTIITAKRFLDRIPLELPDTYRLIILEEAMASIPGTSKLLRFLAVVLLPGWFLDRLVLRLRKFTWDEPLTIIFSSGSTGEPKGVMLSLRNISSNAEGLQKGVNFTTDDRMLCALPYFHSFGYTVCLWAPVSIGMMSLYYPDPRAAKELGELAQRWACTIALGTATFVRFYLRRCEASNFRTVRLFICGAEKLPVSLQHEFKAKFGVPLMEGYGCTELSPVVSTNLPDATVRGVTQVSNRLGTIGQPIPSVVVKAFDMENQQPLPVGTEGILCVKGPNVMMGYLNQPERTAKVMIGPWYITGDCGLVEANGFIKITGRLSRFAKIAGEMVPLERLEEEIQDVLDLRGDRVLAVAAVPDSKRGERVVLLHLQEYSTNWGSLIEKLRLRGLPNLWMPDLRDVFSIEAFPVLGSGKLDLRGLGELAHKLATDKPLTV